MAQPCVFEGIFFLQFMYNYFALLKTICSIYELSYHNLPIIMCIVINYIYCVYYYSIVYVYCFMSLSEYE